MSETGPLLTCAHLNDELMAGTEDERTDLRIKAGVPVPLVELRSSTPNGERPAADGKTPGEMVRARALARRRAISTNRRRRPRLWAGGYLHTGDVGDDRRMTAIVHITDRIKDVIKTGGEWISSLDLEDLYADARRYSEAAVIGDRGRQVGRATAGAPGVRSSRRSEVEAKPRSRRTSRPSSTKASSRSSPFRSQMLFVEALDRTSVGKLDKKALREKYG